MPDQHDHDERHDLGLLYDLATLRTRAASAGRMERRRALQLMGVGGVGLLLAACGASGSSGTGSTTTSAGASSSTAAGGAAAGGIPTAIPEETGGPFPADGTNGPNVLTESGIVRTDIRSSFGQYSGTATGVPLTVALTIVEAGSGDPIEGAAVYLWHCDIDGGYSLYSHGVTDQNYLRGVQAAGADGTLGFTSIYPAAYSGRWPHLHFEVFPNLSSATSAGSRLVTSQIALPADLSAEVYATDGYEQSVTNLARSSLATDLVFRDGATLQTPTVSGDVRSDLRIALTVAV
jgi:protocatechuate 3,4-dioxygenase beta subunit